MDAEMILACSFGIVLLSAALEHHLAPCLCDLVVILWKLIDQMVGHVAEQVTPAAGSLKACLTVM
uniref:Secreted protein n=1 Tax=Rhizophora mucronata TaxID=61149 RepID=A0A2P2JJX8_RHIMU